MDFSCQLHAITHPGRCGFLTAPTIAAEHRRYKRLPQCPRQQIMQNSTQLQLQLLRKPDMKHNHIKTIPKIVVCDAGTEQLTRTFTELTTRKIEINQMCFPRLRLAPRPETD